MKPWQHNDKPTTTLECTRYGGWYMSSNNKCVVCSSAALKLTKRHNPRSILIEVYGRRQMARSGMVKIMRRHRNLPWDGALMDQHHAVKCDGHRKTESLNNTDAVIFWEGLHILEKFFPKAKHVWVRIT